MCWGFALHAFSEHSLRLGRGWVAGSKRGKQEDEDPESDTDLATIQKGPKYFVKFVLYCHMHKFATILHVFVAYLTYFSESYLAYNVPYIMYCILSICYIVYCIVHVLHIFHILHIMYIMHSAYICIKCIFSMYYICCIHISMFILQILLLCPATEILQRQRRRWRGLLRLRGVPGGGPAGWAGRWNSGRAWRPCTIELY